MAAYDNLTVGVLALQGDFERHIHRLRQLGISSVEVRSGVQLESLNGLIIPGGESTTINNLLDRFKIRSSLEKFCRNKPVWGTCAGMIMLAREVDDTRIKTLDLIDIKVVRNGYGRQINSFSTKVTVNLEGKSFSLMTDFIRAPRVEAYSDQVCILAEHNDCPVLLSQDKYLASSFHTELVDDLTLTQFFVDKFVLKYGI